MTCGPTEVGDESMLVGMVSVYFTAPAVTPLARVRWKIRKKISVGISDIMEPEIN